MFMVDRFISASVWGREAVKFRTGQEDNHEWQLGKNMVDEDPVLLTWQKCQSNKLASNLADGQSVRHRVRKEWQIVMQSGL